MKHVAQFVVDTPGYSAVLKRVARGQMKRRARAYEELSIFEAEDLSQELYVRILEEDKRDRIADHFIATPGDFRDYLLSMCEVIARRGDRLSAAGRSIPMSQLTKRDKFRLWHNKGLGLEATFDEIFERQEHWG